MKLYLTWKLIKPLWRQITQDKQRNGSWWNIIELSCLGLKTRCSRIHRHQRPWPSWLLDWSLMSSHVQRTKWIIVYFTRSPWMKRVQFKILVLLLKPDTNPVLGSMAYYGFIEEICDKCLISVIFHIKI